MDDRLIVALDVPGRAQALRLVDRLQPAVRFFKIGLELFCAEGPDLVREVKQRGVRVFLDLKLHDIPNTVGRAVTSAARLGVDLMTVHASGGRTMLKAAAEAAAACPADRRPRIVAVTCLTSLSQDDLTETGVTRPLGEQALELARLSMAGGLDGVVCSPLEAATLRGALGPVPLLVTPGIRMPDDATGDQKRIATPSSALRAGSSYLVVGRPITQADEPADAARRVLEEMTNK